MEGPLLSIPEEPVQLKQESQALLAEGPEDGLRLLEAGEWLIVPFWDAWQKSLEHYGMDYEDLQRVLASYRNEVRLWVVGERTWEHVATGLAGRVSRRIAVAEGQLARAAV